MMRWILPVLSTLVFQGCDYTAPLDPNADIGANTIAGTIVVNGTRELGPVMVLIYNADDPPPPAGTGRPVSIGTVPPDRFNTDLDGLLAADFAVPDLPDGDYLVSALMDLDEDFHPLLANGALAGATCGDWLGAYVEDVLAPELAVVSVSGGILQDRVTVTIANPVPLERPAFMVTEGILDRTLAGSSPTTPQLFRLSSTPIHSAAGIDMTGPFSGTNPCDTAFHIMVNDRDVDGIPDPHPDPSLAAIGLLDISPQIFLQYVGLPDETGQFINDLNEDEAYLGQAVVFPDFLATTPGFPLNTPVLLTDINAMWLPGGIHIMDDRTTIITNPLALPAGGWGVSIISFTGQTWTVPNGLAAFESTDPAFDPLSQLSFVLVE